MIPSFTPAQVADSIAFIMQKEEERIQSGLFKDQGPGFIDGLQYALVTVHECFTSYHKHCEQLAVPEKPKHNEDAFIKELLGTLLKE